MEQRYIDELYAAFQCYPLQDKIDGCPHCELDKSEKSLHGRSLRELTWSDFGVYPFKAMTTFGDVNDFKHFLPRLLELYVTAHAGSFYGVEILFEKLQYAHWETWPASEIKAVRNYVQAWYQMLDSQAKDAEESRKLEELQTALSEVGLDR
jgi:hypothetical protein